MEPLCVLFVYSTVSDIRACKNRDAREHNIAVVLCIAREHNIAVVLRAAQMLSFHDTHTAHAYSHISVDESPAQSLFPRALC